MKSYEKVFNYIHMTGIRDKYYSCAKDIDDATKYVEKLYTLIRDSYNGQAKLMVEDTIIKLREHLLLLQSCHSNSAKFVRYARKEMFTWDESASIKNQVQEVIGDGYRNTI